MTRVVGVGAYAPRLRVSADEFRDAWGHFDAPGVETKAVPDADEDALTMAYEAARRALHAADRDPAALARLDFATTTPPMEEEDLTARLASMLGTAEQAATYTYTGSTRAGAQALDAAADAVTDDALALVVASDCPRGEPDSAVEHAAGAGAAAFLVTADAPSPGAILRARGHHVEPYPGTRFRSHGDDTTQGLDVTSYDRDAFRTALGDAVDAMDVEVAVDAAAVQAPDGKRPYRVADALGVDTDQIRAAETVSTLGDTGAASTLLGAATAFADGAGSVLLAAFGSGAGATVFLVENDGVPTALALAGDVDLTYPEYLRRRGTLTSGAPDGGGAYVSVPSWQRTTPQRHRLVVGRCPDCGALAFPPSGACRSCGSLVDYGQVRLPGTGTVETATTISQGGAPPEFVEQQARSGEFESAVVAFDGPQGEDAVSVPVQVAASDGRGVEIGDSVEATVRRLYRQEDVVRYALKVVPRAARR